MLTAISREDAHAKGLKFFYTGLPCRRGHVSRRYVSTGGCVECLGQFKAPSAQGNRSAISNALVRCSPTTLYMPKALTPVQGVQLEAFLRQCVVHWVRTQNMLTPELEAAYGTHEHLATQAAKLITAQSGGQ